MHLSVWRDAQKEPESGSHLLDHRVDNGLLVFRREYEEAEHSLMNSFAFWGYQLRLWYTGFPLGTRMAILVVCGLAGCCIMYLMLRKEAAD